MLLAVDIAKDTHYAGLSAGEQEADTVRLHWDHVDESPALLAALKRLGGPVVMEPSGTYGDWLRHLCRQTGFSVFQASPKWVYDAREVFDGVPSLHDGKSARLIAWVYRSGLTRPWLEPTEQIGIGGWRCCGGRTRCTSAAITAWKPIWSATGRKR